MIDITSLPPQASPTTYQQPAGDLLSDGKNAPSVDALVIEKMEQHRATTGTVGVRSLPKSLVITGQEIVAKLNEMLAEKLPNGIESLSPEEVTSEATADRIVKQVTALFDAYARQNPNASEEELIDGFMQEARSGVQQGYDDAFSILEGLGAFAFEGVQSGIAETKRLIDEKLNTFEKQKRIELGLDPPEVKEQVSTTVKEEVLALGGQRLALAA